jgi:anti-sigma B factor antagonist
LVFDRTPSFPTRGCPIPEKATIKFITLETKRSGDCAVVRCHGRLVSGGTDILLNEVKPLIPESKRIVLDLTDLEYIDSTGLGTLVRLYVSGKSAGCSLELINIGKRVGELLGLTNLWSVFAVVGEHHIRM